MNGAEKKKPCILLNKIFQYIHQEQRAFIKLNLSDYAIVDTHRFKDCRYIIKQGFIVWNITVLELN